MGRTRHVLGLVGHPWYEWLDYGKVSRIRMLLSWQTAGGLPYVAGVYHRVMGVFLTQGSTGHCEGRNTVSLEEFQNAIIARHRIGDDGLQGRSGGEVYAVSADWQ